VTKLIYLTPAERRNFVASNAEDFAFLITAELCDNIINGVYQIMSVTENVSENGLTFNYNIHFKVFGNDIIVRDLSFIYPENLLEEPPAE